MIETLLLDFYGTIAHYGDDIHDGEERTWRQIFERLVRHRPELSFDRFLAEWKGQYQRQLTLDEVTEESVFYTKIALTCSRCGVEPESRMVVEMGRACLETWHRHIHLPVETGRVLSHLAGRYRLGLVSNFDHPAHLRGLLARHDLTKFFTVVLISGDIGITKPDRRIFEMALERIGARAAATAFVGDSLQDDIAGARAAGCLPILVDPTGNHHDYHGLKVRSLIEILDLDLVAGGTAPARGT
jgi:putative hydrolase of the HAD superfamily